MFRPPERPCARAIFLRFFCDFGLRTHISVCALVFRSGEHPPGAAIRQQVLVCRNSYTCTRPLHSKLQQSRHLASSIIAMPSVMFKDIGKACSGALAHASEAVRLKAKSCSVVARVRALLRRSAQQGLQDWQVDGRAEDEDARGARTRRRHQARWGAARQPQPRFRVRRRSRRMAARTTRAHSPAASSSSTRR